MDFEEPLFEVDFSLLQEDLVLYFWFMVVLLLAQYFDLHIYF